VRLIAVSMIPSIAPKPRFFGELSNSESESAGHDVAVPVSLMSKEMAEAAERFEKTLGHSQEQEDESSPHWTAQELVGFVAVRALDVDEFQAAYFRG
jgi:hypothetical protein